MPAELPQRIAYLASVMNELSRFEPTTLGDDNPDAFALVESAVRLKLRGLDGSNARRTLEDDRTALGDWLNQPGTEMSTGHFIYGALLGVGIWADFDELTQ
jgi:hypothetical protein